MDLQSRYTEALKKFVQDHLEEDPALLLFRHQGKTDFDLKEAVQQISARQKAKSKLPTWAANPYILFPPAISLEQSSSEETAIFKSTLVTGNSFLDMTTGFGVDAFYIGKNFDKAICLERQEELAGIVKNNFEILHPGHFEVLEGDGVEFLQDTPQKFDVIYLDPARRGEHNRKLYRLADCEPDVISLWPILVTKAQQVMIKASPMLDIKGVIQELPDIQKIIVLSVKNEVKEILLFWNEKNQSSPTQIEAIDLNPSKKSSFHFDFEQEEQAEVVYGEVEKYLVEPISSILKAGAFKLFANEFRLKKLHPNSHLYTSSSYPEGVPGKVFEVLSEIKADKKTIKNLFPCGKVNVITRNYAMKADEFKKKFKLRDGGEDFLIGTKVGERYRLFHGRIV